MKDYVFQHNLWKNNFSHLGKISKINLLEGHNVNSQNYLVSTKNSSYVLHHVNDGSSFVKINHMCLIQQFCHRHKAKVTKSIKNSKGQYVNYSQKYFLTKYYPGKTFSGNKNELLSISKELATLHKILSKYPLPFNFRLNQKNYRILTINELNKISKIIDKKNSFYLLDKSILKNLKYLYKILSEFENLTSITKIPNQKIQLIHHDLHPNNVIFGNNKVSAIIDFSNMRKGNVLEDIFFTGYRFSSFNNQSDKHLKKNLFLFLDNYLKYNSVKPISEELFRFFLTKKFLERLSFIMRKNYFSSSDAWVFDFNYQLKMLKQISCSDIFPNIA